jgi:hypothetical protein
MRLLAIDKISDPSPDPSPQREGRGSSGHNSYVANIPKSSFLPYSNNKTTLVVPQ